MMAHTREAVRVKVKKCEQNRIPEWRKFSVDPQITSLEVLYSLLAKAFDIKCDFSIKYKAFDPAGNEIYLAVLSDWDLDAAFLRIHNISIQTATEPCLILQIDIKPFTEVKEWDCETPSGTASGMTTFSSATGGVGAGTGAGTGAGSGTTGTAAARELISPLQQSFGVSQKYMQHMQTKLPGLIMNQMEKTFSIVQKAFNLSDETMASLPPRAPLSDNEFRLFLDALGQVQRSDELRKVIFFGGIDPSLRRVVWKHILNVYPSGMNGQQRLNFMRRKSEQYYALRDTWKTAIKQGHVVGELAYVTGMVKKDVLRTDRLHPFYAGSDDNLNIASLFNILTTYALNHPAVNYCQGMSDIASPLLVTMNDEAQAYICFCAIMARVRGNFMIDGIAMTQKFAHLTEALSYYDPEFWDYLKAQQADDLLFCYRWLLLEMKREFPFEDALRMLEVQWSSLKYEANVSNELSLYEKEFVPFSDTSVPASASSIAGSLGAMPLSPSYLIAKPRENPYTKVCALRRQSSLASLNSLSTSGTSNGQVYGSSLDTSKRLNQSLDDNISRHAARRQRHVASSKAHQSLDETKMLQLMEAVDDEQPPSQSNNVTSDDGTTDDTDDDVFIRNDMEPFNFHPTNPFKDDTELKPCDTPANDKDQCTATKLVKPTAHIPSAFRISSSSSLPEDEVAASCEAVAKNTPQPKSIAKLHNKNILSNYNTVSNIIAKQLVNATNVGDSVKRVGSGGGGHFKDLKEKIAATSRKAGISFEETSNGNEKSQQKLVKNFNEFLNFAAINKNRLTDKFAATAEENRKAPAALAAQQQQKPDGKIAKGSPPCPMLHLSKSGVGSSLDDSDEESSSVPETTWSGSTAATAIQQSNNWSMNSLHLELNSLSSASHTPERTPILERQPIADDRNSAEKSTVDGSSAPTSRNVVNLPHEPSLTPDDSQEQEPDQEYYPMTTAITRELRLEAENLDRQVFGELAMATNDSGCDIEYEKLGKDTLDLVEDLKENEIRALPDVSELLVRRRKRNAKMGDKSEAMTRLSNCHSHNLVDSDESWQRQRGSCYIDVELPQHKMDKNLNVNQQMARNVLVNVNALVHAPPTALRTNSLDATVYGAGAIIAANKSNPFIDEKLLSDGDNVPALRMPNSNSLPEVLVPISTDSHDESPVELATNASDEIAFAKSPQKYSNARSGSLTPTPAAAPVLPPPTEFGGGNPFLMFLCLTLLLQHRNTIMKSGMDYNEIAMHFDKMVRKHDVTRVLNQARRMYIDYLKLQNAYKQQMHLANDINRNPNDVANRTMQKPDPQQQQQQQHQQQRGMTSSTATSS